MSIRTIFDCMVKPIILYGCETCGFGSNEITERLHLKLCLKVKQPFPVERIKHIHIFYHLDQINFDIYFLIYNYGITICMINHFYLKYPGYFSYP
jgi:hypothetical protein